MEKLIGLGKYTKEDYPIIYQMTEDRDKMDDTWEDWKGNHEKAKRNFEELGVKINDILVKPQEWLMYCKERNLRLNKSSRVQFISYKTSKLEE